MDHFLQLTVYDDAYTAFTRQTRTSSIWSRWQVYLIVKREMFGSFYQIDFTVCLPTSTNLTSMKSRARLFCSLAVKFQLKVLFSVWFISFKHEEIDLSLLKGFYNRLNRSIISWFSFSFALIGAKSFVSFNFCSKTLVIVAFGGSE